MEYVYAALLLHKAGKEVSEKNVTEVMKAAGIKVDDSRVKALEAALKDVNIDEAIQKAASVAVAAAPAASAEAPVAAEAEEEPEAEVSEEETAAGLGALFG